jgi:riboflavin synthase
MKLSHDERGMQEEPCNVIISFGFPGAMVEVIVSLTKTAQGVTEVYCRRLSHQIKVTLYGR